MRTMAKVSVIIPVYNVSEYLPKSVESALKQTERDIEVILVDDGSTDISGTVCDLYANRDGRVRVIHKENGGLSSARNAGTAAATGEYVMFLDGDDHLREDAVEKCLGAMTDHPCDFVQFLYREVTADEIPEKTADIREIYTANTPREQFENLYRLGGTAASCATKFMCRLLALEIPFENVRHEDEMWCTRAFSRGVTVTYLPEELYYYVMREDSIVHGKFSRSSLDIFRVREERESTLRALGLENLFGKEYAHLFGAVVRLYGGARAAGDKYAVGEIRRVYEKHKKEIAEYADLHGKYKLLELAMYRVFKTVDMYWVLKRITQK